MISEVWVWAWLPGDLAPTLAGRFEHQVNRDSFRGRFVYGKSYLANRDALALDPLQLKLADRTYETANLQGFFGPLRDAMPDDWGRYVIDRQYGEQPELTGYLLHSRGDHIGNLAFSATRDAVPEDPELLGLEIIEDARAVLRGLEDGRKLDPQLAEIVRPNTALGGARPKLTIQQAGKQWIAKFPANVDRGAPIARVEAAMLELARRCGIDAARAQVVHGDVLLVERFDRAWVKHGGQQGWRRDSFVSAQTIFYSNAELQAFALSGSYPRLALEMAKFSERVSSDREQLYSRMVFNCCISNTDDHDRNHGFLAADTPGMYLLSPAYDMVPRRHATKRREHALAIGDEGFIATRSNLLSNALSFGLSNPQALEILDHVQAVVGENWKGALREQGLRDEQIQDWAQCFEPLPEVFEGTTADEPERRRRLRTGQE